MGALTFLSYGIFQRWVYTRTRRNTQGVSDKRSRNQVAYDHDTPHKVLLVGNIFLIIGQIFLAAATTTYFITLLYFKERGL